MSENQFDLADLEMVHQRLAEAQEFRQDRALSMIAACDQMATPTLELLMGVCHESGERSKDAAQRMFWAALGAICAASARRHQLLDVLMHQAEVRCCGR
jgi:hypothetical protein